MWFRRLPARYARDSVRCVKTRRQSRTLSTIWKISRTPAFLASSWKELSNMDQKTYELGLGIRKDVIGKEFVEKALATADDFTRPLQELVTEYCWGACWGREGLSRKTRSMLNLAMLGVLNRPNELKNHVAGALRNGVTPEEIREILLQVAIYAGIPAGVDSFRVAHEVIKSHSV